jgi:hypothetical protein
MRKKSKMLRESSIRRTSRNIAEKLFQKALPEALSYLQEAENWTFTPPLERITFGPKDPTLRVASIIFDSIADALQDIAESLREVSSPEEVRQLFVKSLAEKLSGRVERSTFRDAIDAVTDVLQELPLVDQISVVPFEMDRVDACERILRGCVLKAIDPKDGSISTAFALCGKGHILTAAHVGGGHAYLNLAYQGKEGRAKIIYRDFQKDIAILQVAPDSWERFLSEGLRPPPLAIRAESELRGIPVVCLGFQDSHVFVDPVGVHACTLLFSPVMKVKIEGAEYNCLVLVVTEREGNVCITYGMSGGPVMDSRAEACEVIAMIIGVWQPGAERRAQAYYPSYRRWAPLSAREFGFGITLSEVAESWPELRACCLAQQKS